MIIRKMKIAKLSREGDYLLKRRGEARFARGPLGIVQWKQRPVPVPIVLQLLHDVATARYWVVVGDKTTDAAIPAAKDCLKNLLKTMGWSIRDCAFATWEQATDPVPLDEQMLLLGAQQGLLFGTSPVEVWPLPMITLPPLTKILASQQAKQKAHTLLQELRSL